MSGSSNGVRCCLLGVCCPPVARNAPAGARDNWETKRKASLATMILQGDDTLTTTQAAKVAAFLYSELGFVPIGVDEAMVELYRPFFEAVAAQGAGAAGATANAAVPK